MANKEVKNKLAIVTGNPNSPLGFGRKRVYTATYDSTGTTNTLSGVGPLKLGDFIQVLTTKTNTAAGYAGISWNAATTVYSVDSGTVGLIPTNAVPDADVTITVLIDNL